jgi:hypothetical protein
MENALKSKSDLEIFLSQSQFKKQVDLLGHDAFAFLSSLYEEGKFDERMKLMFPEEKRKEFDEISAEMLEDNGIYIKTMYKYLSNSVDYRPKVVFGKAYQSVMRMEDTLVERLGNGVYSSIYKNFVNGQFNDSLKNAEGDDFFYINDTRFVPANKDEELIWTVGKVIELLYDIGYE